MSRSQLGSVATGLAIALVGVLLLLDAEGTIDPDGWLLAAVTGLSGAALVASGISAREP